MTNDQRLKLLTLLRLDPITHTETDSFKKVGFTELAKIAGNEKMKNINVAKLPFTKREAITGIIDESFLNVAKAYVADLSDVLNEINEVEKSGDWLPQEVSR